VSVRPRVRVSVRPCRPASLPVSPVRPVLLLKTTCEKKKKHMSSKSSRGQLVFRSSLLYVWVTRGAFGRRTKSLCDFGDMTPHTLVGGAQTTLTARASVRADRRNDPREAWGPRGDTQSRPPEALDRCAGVTEAVRTARNTRHHSYLSILKYSGEGVNAFNKVQDARNLRHFEVFLFPI
jgi:hypothetical protein